MANGAKKVGTRPRKSAQDDITDGRVVLEQARGHMDAIAAANKGRKIPLVTAKELDQFEAQLDGAESSVGGQVVVKTEKLGATITEVKARKALQQKLRSIRDDVALAHDGDVALQRAFGRGRNLSSNVTSTLTGTASAVIEAYKKPANQKRAIEAGVTAARIKDLAAAAAALTAADKTQRVRFATSRTHTRKKKNQVTGIRKTTVRLRRVLKRVVGDDAAAAAALKSTVTRRKPKKRAAARKPAKTPE